MAVAVVPCPAFVPLPPLPIFFARPGSRCQGQSGFAVLRTLDTESRARWWLSRAAAPPLRQRPFFFPPPPPKHGGNVAPRWLAVGVLSPPSQAFRSSRAMLILRYCFPFYPSVNLTLTLQKYYAILKAWRRGETLSGDIMPKPPCNGNV